MNKETVLIPTLSTFIEDQWEKTKGITTPKFSGVFDLYPNQEFQALILLGKYEIKNDKVMLKIEVSLEHTKTGKVLSNTFNKLQGDLTNYIGFILFPKFNIFKFTEQDEEGIYNFILRVKDVNSETEFEVKNEITFHKNFNILQKHKTDLQEWIQDYYLNPKPTELISYYFKDLEENDALSRDASIIFYVEAFNHSLFLVDEIEKLLKGKKLSQLQRNGLNILLARSNYQNVENLGFSSEELKILHEFRDEFYNPLEKEINHPSELDMIWSLFFANGEFKNVEKIISTLYYKKDIREEEAKNLPEKEFLKYAIGRASAWSLETIGRFHPMVQVYMIYVLNQPTTSDFLKQELSNILNQIKQE